MNKLDNAERGINWLERVLTLVDKYKLKSFLKAIFIILMIAGTVGFITNPTFLFEKFAEWQSTKHNENMEIRMIANQKIQMLLDKSIYKIGCKRITVGEFHNGNSNSSGLPFAKYTITFESVADNIMPVAHQYQSQLISLSPFINKLFKTGYWSGNTEEIKDIDRSLYHRLSANGCEHFAACILEGLEYPLAILFVSFNDADGHNCEEVRQNLRHLAMEMSFLLELSKKAPK